ncbi:PrsW family intramembrane metalloprotease [Demequina capsici]|uniref:PrsW family intramembrane metalloprotease n=1 Tax=Demequina capsici TaxID=3075620 RepID=A0AA96JAI3_9MICO|nr:MULTISPECIES: PrsW family intramembrane metalloprotease [unclassified Demequina]WNM24721.1 PrsW family intramembrane metalloprotease [Demequina sp. OYTSA14]WNM27630.1 PrsW family intramembrane metalloprotease [Demequina sp. PMTSA13]
MIAPRTSSVLDFRHPVMWVGMVLFAAGAVRLAPAVVTVLVDAPGPGLLAFSLWTAYGLTLGLLVYRFEMFERRSLRTTAVAFASGAVLVPGIAMVASPALHGILASLRGGTSEWDSAIAAPLVEEPLKMLVVVALALIPGARVRNASDGLFYGVVVGLGFQVTENFLYSTQWSAQGTSLSVVMQTFVLRGFVTGLWSHATYTAITGAAVGFFFGSTRRLPTRTLTVVLSLGAAMLLHGFFNSPLLNLGVVPAAIIKGIPVLVLGLVTLRWVHLRERSALGADARDLVPDEHVSPADFAALSSRRVRQRARSRMAAQYGTGAAIAFGRLQRAQLDTLITAHDDGLESARYVQALQELRYARKDVAAATAPPAWLDTPDLPDDATTPSADAPAAADAEAAGSTESDALETAELPLTRARGAAPMGPDSAAVDSVDADAPDPMTTQAGHPSEESADQPRDAER